MLRQRGGPLRFIFAFAVILAVLLSKSTGNAIIGMMAGAIAMLGGLSILMKFGKKPHTVDVTHMVSFRRHGTAAVVALLILALFVYFFRPWFHDLAMGFYRLPVIWAVLVSAGLIILFVNLRQYILTIVSGALLLISLAGLVFNFVIIQNYIVDNTDYNKISALPDSDQLRILPKAVARRYLEDSLQKSREKVGDLNIVNIDNSLFWIAPRIPDGTILYFTQKVNGLMLADASKSDRSTQLITKTLSIGEGIGITDNINWRIFKTEYWLDIGDIYYIYKDDRVYTVAPIIRYTFRFPVMVPYYGGVFVVDEDGVIAVYGPTEIVSEPLFQGNRAFPEELARLYVDSYKYNLGVWNTWFLHKDQIEITDVYGQGNQQPFLMPTADGLKWIVATEPYGESYGVFKIFLVDALTGRIDMMEMNEDQTLTGPVRVVSYVKKKFPRIDWSTSRIAEPRPYVVDGSLYWMLSITPMDFAGISYSVFVNSENNEVSATQSDSDTQKFISGEPITIDAEEAPSEDMSQIIDEIEQRLAKLKELVEEAAS
jgi:hypothetical protein